MRDVFFLPFAPWRLRVLIGVGASGNNRAHFLSEELFDLALTLRSATFLHRVVEEGGDGFGLVGPVLERDRCHSEKMADVGDLCFLAQLSAMDASRIDQSFFKFWRE